MDNDHLYVSLRFYPVQRYAGTGRLCECTHPAHHAHGCMMVATGKATVYPRGLLMKPPLRWLPGVGRTTYMCSLDCARHLIQTELDR